MRFILACQDPESGGFSDRPGNLVDPFHTLFGIAGLSLLTHEYNSDSNEDKQENCETEESDISSQLEVISESIKPINPVFCMPQTVIDRTNLKPQYLSL